MGASTFERVGQPAAVQRTLAPGQRAFLLAQKRTHYTQHKFYHKLPQHSRPPAAQRNKAQRHLSRSLNTRMAVLYTLMASSTPSPPGGPRAEAWYTFASLPVDTQPLISSNTPRLSILNRTCERRRVGHKVRRAGD